MSRSWQVMTRSIIPLISNKKNIYDTIPCFSKIHTDSNISEYKKNHIKIKPTNNLFNKQIRKLAITKVKFFNFKLHIVFI